MGAGTVDITAVFAGTSKMQMTVLMLILFWHRNGEESHSEYTSALNEVWLFLEESRQLLQIL